MICALYIVGYLVFGYLLGIIAARFEENEADKISLVIGLTFLWPIIILIAVVVLIIILIAVVVLTFEFAVDAFIAMTRFFLHEKPGPEPVKDYSRKENPIHKIFEE